MENKKWEKSENLAGMVWDKPSADFCSVVQITCNLRLSVPPPPVVHTLDPALSDIRFIYVQIHAVSLFKYALALLIF